MKHKFILFSKTAKWTNYKCYNCKLQNWKIDGRSKNDNRLKILRSATKVNYKFNGLTEKESNSILNLSERSVDKFSIAYRSANVRRFSKCHNCTCNEYKTTSNNRHK